LDPSFGAAELTETQEEAPQKKKCGPNLITSHSHKEEEPEPEMKIVLFERK